MNLHKFMASAVVVASIHTPSWCSESVSVVEASSTSFTIRAVESALRIIDRDAKQSVVMPRIPTKGAYSTMLLSIDPAERFFVATKGPKYEKHALKHPFLKPGILMCSVVAQGTITKISCRTTEVMSEEVVFDSISIPSSASEDSHKFSPRESILSYISAFRHARKKDPSAKHDKPVKFMDNDAFDLSANQLALMGDRNPFNARATKVIEECIEEAALTGEDDDYCAKVCLDRLNRLK